MIRGATHQHRVVEQKPTFPSDWFGFHFPAVAKIYGPAILERRLVMCSDSSQIIPVQVNEDFFAGMLGTEKCHRTFFHQHEMQFYQKSPTPNFYEPIEERALKLMLSQWFIKCVGDMSGRIDISTIFTTFRSKEVLEAIIERAKAVLAVNEEYFSPEGENARNPATAPKESVRLFVDACLGVEEDTCLTVQECFDGYQQYCRDRKLASVPRNNFKATIIPHIQRRFSRGIRNDLNRFNADKCTGWYGVRLVHPG